MTTENQSKSERLAFPDTIPSEYGFITIDREFVNWSLFHDDAAWKMMCYLLMRANYKTRFWGIRTINPGEYVTSYAHIGEDLHKSRDEVKRLLTKLKNIGEVKTTRLGNALLISMPNYLKYQRFRTRRHKDSARPEPDLSPGPDHQALTTKENKPGNNFKRKENYTHRQNFSDPDNGGFVSLGAIFARQMEPPPLKYHFKQFPPDRSEVELYVKNNNMDIDLDHFFEHYERTDWCNQKGKKLGGWHFALHRLVDQGIYI